MAMGGRAWWCLRRETARGDGERRGDRGLRVRGAARAVGGAVDCTGGGAPPVMAGAAAPWRQKAGAAATAEVFLRPKRTAYAFQAAHAACVRSPLTQAAATLFPAASNPGQGAPKRARYREGHSKWAWAQPAHVRQTVAPGGPPQTARRGPTISAEQGRNVGRALGARGAAAPAPADAAPSDAAAPAAAGCAWGRGGGGGGGV